MISKRITELKQTVFDLIESGTEGTYWDFKRDPYIHDGLTDNEKNNKKTALLYDILCLANNIDNKEAYLIMGVSDSFDIPGVQSFSNRWTRESYQQFIEKAVEWSGDFCPTIEVHTIDYDYIDGCQLEVIVIKKSNHVPFMLEENYRNIYKGRVYLRKGTKNTDRNSTPSIHDIETLFKYRLGYSPYPKERLESYIRNRSLWSKMRSDYESEVWYYEPFPEYTIELKDDPETKTLNSPPFAHAQVDHRSDWHTLKVNQHQTILLNNYAHTIDGNRGIVIHPELSHISITDDFQKGYLNMYYYYLENSTEYALHQLLQILRADGSSGIYEEIHIANSRHMEYVVLFEDLDHKESFEQYVRDNYIDNTDYDLASMIDSTREQMPIVDEKNFSKDELVLSRLMNDWLHEFNLKYRD